MDFGLSGKRALVLGASRGLGAACATLLAEEGATVLAVSRSGMVPKGSGTGIEGRAVDLSDKAVVATLAEEIRADPVQILVNNCGGPAPGPARDQSTEAWRAAFDAMATPVFALTDAALEGMTARKWGRIVSIGSSGIEVPIPGLALSNGIRASVAGWSKTLASEVAAAGVTVNMVLPGRIGTDRVAELDRMRAEKTDKTVEEIAAASRATIPTGRYGTPVEFAAAVVFLCAEPAGYITGSMIRVDGGMIRSL